MEDREYYLLPGGVCPACEHSPLWLYTDTPEPRIYCEECGFSDNIPKVKNRDMTARNNSIQQIWAKAVQSRDKACVVCGAINDLVTHHLISASKIPDLQNRIGNGITVCRRCHKLIHDNTTKWPEKYR